jgi:hypothetical protein
MAEKAIDATVAKHAKTICAPTEEWQSQHHSMLIWTLFRQELGYNPPKEKLAELGKKWGTLFADGRLAYSSNCAKGLAAAGICKASGKAAVEQEYK